MGESTEGSQPALARECLVVAWIRHNARSKALAERLEAPVVFMPWAWPGQPLTATLVGWLRSAHATFTAVRSLAPGALVVVQAPPVFAPLTARLAIAGRRASLVLDAHSGAFNDRRWRWSLPFLRAVIRRSAGVIVTNRELVSAIGPIEVPLLVLHDPLTDRRDSVSHVATGQRPYVVFPASGSWDEPLDAVLGAAKLLRGRVDIFITGDNKVSSASAAHLTGFLPEPEYRRLLERAGAVLALCSRDATMQRAAYEALELGLPVVCSSTRVLREALDRAAVYVENEALSIAAGIEEALARRSELQREGATVLGAMRKHSDHVVDQLRSLGART